jgi:hypothetical protein
VETGEARPGRHLAVPIIRDSRARFGKVPSLSVGDTGMLAAGFTFVTLGTLFLLDRFGLWHVDTSYIVPLILINLGLAVLLGGWQSRRHHVARHGPINANR